MKILNSTTEYEELGEGTVIQDILVKPAHYLSNGIWKPINNILKNTGDPEFTVGSNEIFNFRIKNKLSGNAPFIHIEKGNNKIRYTPLNTNNVDGIINGNSITFTEAWNNADLSISVGGHILQKNIYLKKEHPQSFSFRIDDKINLDDNLYGSEFYVSEPYLYKEEKESIPLFWERTIRNGKIILTATLPEGSWEGWTLDPTYVSQPDGTTGNDTQIGEGTPDGNYGGSTLMGIANYDYITYSFAEMKSITKSLIKFDLSTIPPNSTVSSASLYLRNNIQFSKMLTYYRVKRDWNQLQATWNIAKTGTPWGTAGCSNTTSDYDTSLLASAIPTTGDNNITLSSSLIQQMIPGGAFTNNGFIITQNDVHTSSTNANNFRTSNYTTITTHRPKLTIVYTEGGATSVVPQLSSSYMRRRANVY